MVLSVKEIGIEFGGLQAVNGVSLEVKEKEIYGIIGPNGAGKTTLFNLISGVIKPARGEILLCGKPIHKLPLYKIIRAGMGRTFQLVRPFQELPVWKNVLVGLGCRGYGSLGSYFKIAAGDKALKSVEEILSRVGLENYRNEIARTLPMGLLRRLEIARALATSPLIILLDESFSGLSHEEVESLMKLVQELRIQGLSFMVIEHNMRVAIALCDRLMALNYGQTIVEGKPEDVVNNRLVIESYLGRDAEGAGTH